MVAMEGRGGSRSLHYSNQFKITKTWYIHIYIRIHYTHKKIQIICLQIGHSIKFSIPTEKSERLID